MPVPEIPALSYSGEWAAAQPPALAAFRDWTERYRQAGSPAERVALESVGVDLAHARRTAMRALMARDPRAALSATVPAGIRPMLPPAVRAELETRFSVIGDFSVEAADYGLKEMLRRKQIGLSVDPFQRLVRWNGQEYPAYVYGRRETLTTKIGTPLHGVLLDGVAALHESGVRVLESDEAIQAGRSVTEVPARPPAPATGPATVAEIAGQLYRFASPDEVWRLNARLTVAESGLGPHRPLGNDFVLPGIEPTAGKDPTSSSPTTPWTVGNKKILIIRVDFSDLPGNPSDGSTAYTPTYVQNLADAQVGPFYLENSYGATSLTPTVSSRVYRMPQTAAAYAVGYLNSQLHADARNAAAADFALASFDRIAVLFSYLGNIPGSGITYGGRAQVGGPYLWINGEFDFRVVAHEIGHTYGVFHANLWRVADGNPVSANGTSVEYGDDFDVMGANFADDQRTDFNPWFKNLLGWIADSQVQTITNSGVYRVNRFDHSSAAGIVALKVARDASRSYWIGVRRRFTTNASMQHGAYVIWGYNANQGSTLLDLTSPGTNISDAALGVGSTLIDVEGNLLIRNAAEGGTSPHEYLDLLVTINLDGRPVITAQPQSQGFSVGATVTLNVAATGTPPLTYQWLKDDVPLPGATTATFTIANAQAAAAGTYAVQVTGPLASVVSHPALVALNGPPRIISQPVNVTTAAGLTASFDVVVSGFPIPYVYQWRRAGVAIPGATLAALTIPDVQSANAGSFDVLVTNSVGAVASVPVALAVNPSTTPPSNDNFADAWTLAGNEGRAQGSNVTATGQPGEPVHVVPAGAGSSVWFRWTPTNSGLAQVDTIGSRFDSVLAVYTGSSLTALTPVCQDDDSGSAAGGGASLVTFPVVAGTTYAIAVGSFYSDFRGDVVLNYAASGAIAIIAQPVTQTVTAGSTATFSVTAVSTPAPNYQWRKRGTAIAGATAATFTIANVQASDMATYDVVVSNGVSSVASHPVALIIRGDPSLVAYYPFEGDAFDFSGTGNHGAPSAAVNYVPGPVGRAARFDGYNGYVRVPDANSLDLTTAMTVAFWLRLESPNSGGSRSVFSKLSNGTPDGYGMNYYAFGAGDPRAEIDLLASGEAGSPPIIDYTLNTWVHIAVVVSQGTQILYRNGVEVSRGPVAAFPTNGLPLMLGTSNDATNGLLGSLDEFRLYNRALSPTDVLGLTQIAPAISTQPLSQMVAPGANVAFTVAATGLPAPTYQWRKNGTPIDGATGTTLTLSAVTSAAAGTYDAIVSNPAGSTPSDAAVLTVNATSPSIVITSQPASQTVTIGQSVGFTVGATGSPVPTYQWRKDGVTLPGATHATLSLASAQPVDAGSYNVIVTNLTGSVNSGSATLDVIAAPAILAQPANQLVAATQAAIFSVTAFGAPAPAYQWRKGGADIPGATTATYVIPRTVAADAGLYDVLVTNRVGGVTSVAAVLTVREPTPGTVVAWGANSAGQTNIPAGLNDVISVAGGQDHSVALRSDGTVVAWGGNSYGGTSVPAGLSAVIAISSRHRHTLALKSNGTVVAWGSNDYGQLDVPAGLTGVIAVGAGSSHSVALKGDGTVVAWGRNDLEQSSVPAGLAGVVAIAAGSDHTIVRKADGTVLGWGYDSHGQASASTLLAEITAIGAGADHSMAIKRDHTVVAWGRNISNDTVIPAGLSEVIAVTGGGAFSVALKSDGTVRAWGDNSLNQSSVPAGLVRASMVAAGRDHVMAVVSPPGAAPTITTQPASVAVTIGGSASFAVVASGTAPLGYQWRKAGSSLAGATAATLALGEVQPTDAGAYDVVVTNAAGSATSNPATLTVNVPPAITSPSTATFVVGHLGTFTIIASGSPAPTLTVTAGALPAWATFDATTATLSGTPPNATGAPFALTITASNGVAPNATQIFMLQVQAPSVTITSQPVSAAVMVGGAAAFTVTAAGSNPFTYQWYFTPAGSTTPQALNDLAGKFAGTHAATLAVSNVQPADAGDYVCIVTDANGPVMSNAAQLVVTDRSVKIVSQTAPPGATVIVPVQLIAHGDENAIGFSLDFDPTSLAFVSAAAGAQATDATLNFNSAQAAAGRLGLAMAKPSGVGWPAGTNEIVKITFALGATVPAGTVSPLTFGDVPVLREVSSAAAVSLPAGYEGGSITALSGYEADMNGNGAVSVTDWVKVGRIVAGLDPIPSGIDFMKADCAPRNSLGNGSLSVTDWVQAGRYAASLDPLTPVGGPAAPRPAAP